MILRASFASITPVPQVMLWSCTSNNINCEVFKLLSLRHINKPKTTEPQLGPGGDEFCWIHVPYHSINYVLAWEQKKFQEDITTTWLSLVPCKMVDPLQHLFYLNDRISKRQKTLPHPNGKGSNHPPPSLINVIDKDSFSQLRPS